MNTTTHQLELLEHDAQQVLPRLRGALTRLLSTASGGKIRPSTVSRSWGLHQTLAWKLVQIVDNPDPLSTVQHIPGEGGVQILLDAARNHGAPQSAISAVEQAVADFRSLIEAHAGDRASLELMLAGINSRQDSSVDLSIRKAGFRCTSYTWGVQSKARIKTLLLNPGEQSDRFDVASVRGFIGFRRMRPNTPWYLSKRQQIDHDRQVTFPSAAPLDRTLYASDVPLLSAFCTVPMPRIETISKPGGEVGYRLEAGPVGDTAAFNCLLGDIKRDALPRWASRDDSWFDNSIQHRTPTELVVIDTFVHRDLWPLIPPAARIISELSQEPWYSPEHAESNALPCSERVHDLGSGIGAAVLPEYPQYLDVTSFVFDTLGWREAEFRLFRFRMEYPVLRTAAVVRFERPFAPPGSGHPAGGSPGG